MKIITSLYSTVTSYVATLNRDTKGATAIEYAVIAGLMAAALIFAVSIVANGTDGGAFGTFFTKVKTQLAP